MGPWVNLSMARAYKEGGQDKNGQNWVGGPDEQLAASEASATLEAWFRHTHLSDFREAESDSTL